MVLFVCLSLAGSTLCWNTTASFGRLSMGCTLVFTLEKPIHVLFPMGVWGVLIAYYLAECADSISQDLWNICFHIKTMWCIRMQHDCYQPNQDFKNICIQKQFGHSLGGLDSLVCCTRGTLLLPRISGFPDSHIPQCILTSVVLGPFAIGSTIHNLTNDWSIKYPDLNLPAYRL